MSLQEQATDPHLYDLTLELARMAFDYAKRLEREKQYIPVYYKFPSVLRYLDNGFPQFTEDLTSQKPKNYKGIFLVDMASRDRLENSPSFKALLEYIVSNDKLKKYFGSGIDALLPIAVSRFALSIFDRYMHTHQTDTFSVDHFRSIYLLFEAPLFKDPLPINIIVPILFVKFDFDSIALADNAQIWKMDELTQLSRIANTASEGKVPSIIMGAASHALVLTELNIHPNTLLTNPEFINKIDRFFAALRLIFGVDTGYAQILRQPIDWATDYLAYLPDLFGIAIRKYPSIFEGYNWFLAELPTLTKYDIEKVDQTLANLSRGDKRINLATRRLNQCLLRENGEDSIIDAAIALEALCSDDKTQELNFKLRLRVAALMTLLGYPARDVFYNMGKIYDYRSRIVHGASDAQKYQVIEVNVGQDKKSIPTLEIAIEYLRNVLKILLDNPKYLKTKVIEEELVLEQLSVVTDQDASNES